MVISWPRSDSWAWDRKDPQSDEVGNDEVDHQTQRKEEGASLRVILQSWKGTRMCMMIVKAKAKETDDDQCST